MTSCQASGPNGPASQRSPGLSTSRRRPATSPAPRSSAPAAAAASAGAVQRHEPVDARPCDGRHPRTRPSRRRAPRPAGTATVRTPRRARRRPRHGRPQGCDDPVEAVLAQRRRGRQRRPQPPERPVEPFVTGAPAQPQVVRGGEPPASVSRVDPPVVAAEADRRVLDRDDVEPPAAHQRRAHVGIREIRGPGEHPATLPRPLSAGGAPGCAPARAGRCRTAPPRARASAPATPAARASGRRCGAARRPRTRGSTRSR